MFLCTASVLFFLSFYFSVVFGAFWFSFLLFLRCSPLFFVDCVFWVVSSFVLFFVFFVCVCFSGRLVLVWSCACCCSSGCSLLFCWLLLGLALLCAFFLRSLPFLVAGRVLSCFCFLVPVVFCAFFPAFCLWVCVVGVAVVLGSGSWPFFLCSWCPRLAGVGSVVLFLCVLLLFCAVCGSSVCSGVPARVLVDFLIGLFSCGHFVFLGPVFWVSSLVFLGLLGLGLFGFCVFCWVLVPFLVVCSVFLVAVWCFLRGWPGVADALLGWPLSLFAFCGVGGFLALRVFPSLIFSFVALSFGLRFVFFLIVAFVFFGCVGCAFSLFFVRAFLRLGFVCPSPSWICFLLYSRVCLLLVLAHVCCDVSC